MIKGGHNRRGAYFKMAYIVGYPLYCSIYILEDKEGCFRLLAIYRFSNELGLQDHKSPF